MMRRAGGFGLPPFSFPAGESSATRLHLPSAGDVQYEPLVAGPGGPEPLARGVKKEFEKRLHRLLTPTAGCVDMHVGSAAFGGAET